MKKSFLIFLLQGLTLNLFGQINQDVNSRLEFCSMFDVGVDILQEDSTVIGSDTLIKSEFWNGYDVNLPSFGFPDSICIAVKVGSWSCAFDAEDKPGRFFLSVSARLLFSEGNFCLILKNPIISDSINLCRDVLFDGNDFFNNENVYQNIEQLFEMPLLSNVVSETIKNGRGEDDPFYLSQIEIIVKIQSENKSEGCSFIYRHPVCSAVPKTIFNNH